ncbi:MAG: TIGR00268 family protein [Firmicutes bacterium HGW-Firmicutes-7]|nr:MAG: TIGR00268 family protein [Firmicutes bacterium HGW-Firmicutes-7]
MNQKYLDLLSYLKGKGKIVIAFSGGVDSTFLLKAAKEALGNNVKAVTVQSPYIPAWEVQEAKAFVHQFAIEHEIIQLDCIDASIRNNPKDRCYLCKKIIFKQILSLAQAQGYSYVCDGTNFDDTKDYRPGMLALKELNVLSPLLDCNYTKADIRAMSNQLGLPTWNKPAYACLMTRLPYDTSVYLEDLQRIEAAELFMMSLGFKAVRVRHHGNLARIEVGPESRTALFDTTLLDKIGNQLQVYGYTYVTVDVLGYFMGSFNKTIEKEM